MTNDTDIAILVFAVLNAAVAEHRTRLNLAAVLFERRDAQEIRTARREHELADGALADAVTEYVAYIDAEQKTTQ